MLKKIQNDVRKISEMLEIVKSDLQAKDVSVGSVFKGNVLK